MAAEYRQRADLLGTQIITRNTGKRLGVVSQIWVDVDSQEIMALSMKPNLLYGMAQEMLLTSVSQIGDVILVETEDAVEDVDTNRYNSLINCEVITESGDVLGKVRGFKFDVNTGKLASLMIASLGYPLIPDRVLSTYELGIEEIVSSGPDRLIVLEGSEGRMKQVTVGFLEQVGIGKPPWEKDDMFQPPTVVRPENQLPSATRQPMQAPAMYRPDPNTIEETWDEDNWEREPERVEARPPIQRSQTQAPRYFKDEEENWTDAIERDGFQDYDNQDYDNQPDEEYQDIEYTEVTEVLGVEAASPEADPPPANEDPWQAESTPPDYEPKAFKIPEHVKQPELDEG
jgi:sporulation protein YlmC with PRC-barrel domain